MTFRPQIRTEDVGVGDEFSFLASEHGIFKRAGITLDAALVSADDDGDKLLPAGAVLGEVTATGKYGPYDSNAGDGRATARGFLLETVNLRLGDATAGMLIHGSVLEARVSGLDSSGKNQLAGTFIFQ